MIKICGDTIEQKFKIQNEQIPQRHKGTKGTKIFS